MIVSLLKVHDTSNTRHLDSLDYTGVLSIYVTWDAVEKKRANIGLKKAEMKYGQLKMTGDITGTSHEQGVYTAEFRLENQTVSMGRMRREDPAQWSRDLLRNVLVFTAERREREIKLTDIHPPLRR